MNEKEIVLMEAVIAKRKKAEEEKKRGKPEEYTMDDLEKLLVKVNASLNKEEQPVATTVSQTSPPVQPTEKQQIAYSIWKDAKATSIVCLIAIVFPFIAILVAMSPGGGMFAMVIALVGIIYPCFVFVKSISVQTRIYKKYGLKPLFQMPQQQMRNTNVGKKEMF